MFLSVLQPTQVVGLDIILATHIARLLVALNETSELDDTVRVQSTRRKLDYEAG